MDFQPVRYLEKLRPFLANSQFGITDIRYVPLSQMAMGELRRQNINAASYGGQSPVQISKDVIGGGRVQFQANLYLQFVKRFIDEIGNEDDTNFISDFEQWIVYQYMTNRRKIKNPDYPRFGNDSDYDEVLSADGGMLIMSDLTAEAPYALYQVNIRIRYQTIYEKEGW